uniref:NOF-FB transposable element protein n=1 Tax=Sipha flava TaxID=143950 RepID=A0A2S2QTV7_9HEMI
MPNDPLNCSGIVHNFVHFWSNLQLQIYKECYSRVKIPTMLFDATGGCCKKIKRSNGDQSRHLFLYEGVMEIEGKTFTALSMISEQHDILSIYSWLDRWLRCGIKPPKMIVCDQSLALMSAIVQSFTQYKSLQAYLVLCYKLIFNPNDRTFSVLTCYIRNDVSHFIYLITKWTLL